MTKPLWVSGFWISVSWIPRMNFKDDGRLKFRKEFYCKNLRERKQLERSKTTLLPRHPLGLMRRYGVGEWEEAEMVSIVFPLMKYLGPSPSWFLGRLLATSSCIPPKQLWSLRLLCKTRKINARSEQKNQSPEASLTFLASEQRDKGAGPAQDISCCQETEAKLFA